MDHCAGMDGLSTLGIKAFTKENLTYGLFYLCRAGTEGELMADRDDDHLYPAEAPFPAMAFIDRFFS